jgi:hypothetical protein
VLSSGVIESEKTTHFRSIGQPMSGPIWGIPHQGPENRENRKLWRRRGNLSIGGVAANGLM